MGYKKLFIDSDIIIDVLLKREPFVSYAKPLLSGSFKVQLFTSSLIIANVHYVATKYKNQQLVKNSLKELIPTFIVASFDVDSVKYALNHQGVDFEDTIQYHIALKNNCDAIITRNLKHYKAFELPVLTAEQFLRKVLN